MNLTEYENFKGNEFPLKTASGFLIGNLAGKCGSCGEDLSGMKCRVVDFGNCFEAYSVGICKPCKAIVECHKIRRYRDGRFCWLENGAWMTKDRMTFFERIMAFFRLTLWKIRKK